MLRSFYTLCLLSLSSFLFAQMPASDGTIRYGNEWIDYNRSYLKVSVVEDGVYRISPQDITAAGMSLNAENAGKWVLHHEGKAVPIEVSNEGIVFYGEKNRGKMDRYLFESPEEMQLNDRYSMHTDTGRYFLSLTETGGPFYVEAAVSGGTTDLTSILRESEVVFSDHMTKTYSRASGASIYYSHYEPAEGFGSRSSSDLLSSNGSVESTATIPLRGANGNQATLDLRFSLGFGTHVQEIKADNSLLTTITASNWTVHQPQLNFSPNGEEATISLTGTASAQDKANLGWVKVAYPANPVYDETLSGFQIPAGSPASRLQLADVGADAGAMKIYDPAEQRSINGTISGGSATFQLPAKSNEGRYHLVRNNQFLTPAATVSHQFTPTIPENIRTNYLLVTSRRLNGSAVEEMANYRRSATGGNYIVHIVEVEDLYDEFGYGVARHPMALRNYLTAARQASPDLQYLFLVGKGREYADIRSPEQLASERETYFVPSFGFPASDNLLSADLGGVVPKLSTGRLSAISVGEIATYVDKLMGVESQINRGGQTIEDRDWMKQILHLSGGGTAGEQFSIRRNLTRLEATIENSDMGANVTSIYRTSTEPIETGQQDAIFNRINKGTAIITFYGHSSSQGFEFNIDNPANYANKDRYPYMLSLGCYSGDSFTKARSISERFIFLPNKGAVAFAASKGVAYIGALGNWGDELYRLTANEEYGNGIGDAMRKNIEHFSESSSRSITILLEQFSLSGDPAYRLHPQPGPDVVIDPTSVRFTPDVVPAQEEEYTVELRVLNLGNGGGQDSITLRFSQELPDGEVREIHRQKILTPNYDGVHSFQLPNQGLASVGLNRIFITLDADDQLRELPAPSAELNNDLISGGSPGVPLTFIANTAKVAFPPEYAVIGGPIELIASSTNALAEVREYIFEISLDRKFRNLVTTSRATSPGGIIRYQPDFVPADSTTYYWRISPDSLYTEGAGYIWSESSFTWLADQPEELVNWAMQEPGQLVDGDFKNIVGDTLQEVWNFARNSQEMRIFNAVYASSSMPRLMINTQSLASPFAWDLRAGISVLVVDSLNNGKWYPNRSRMGMYNTSTRSSSTWNFNTRNEAGRKGLIQFLGEAIPTGRYVFLYSLQRGNTLDYFSDDWNTPDEETGKTIFDALEEQGAQQIRRLNESGPVPYVLAYQQDIGVLEEVLANEISDTILMETQIFGNWPNGKWSSAEIGPVKEWESMSFKLSSQNLESTDSVRIRLIGISSTNEEVMLFDENVDFENTENFVYDLSAYNETSIYKMRADIYFIDEENRSSPSVNELYFNYTPYGDVAINPQFAYTAPDSVDQGESIDVTVGYENISRTGFDSLLIALNTIDENNQVTSQLLRNPPLAPSANGQISFSVPTNEYTQDLQIEVTLNPLEDQPEEVLFNNTLTTKVKLNRDFIDPLLNVYFDGQKIREGDVVSSSPEILIDIKDENRNLLLNDTSAYRLTLTYPDGVEETVSFSDSRLVFAPAVLGQENEAKIFFNPVLAADGRYILQVTGRDRSGNVGGIIAYRKEFEVINEQLVSNVLTYPNPFTTQTRFVYTLTGSEPPTTFRIQIMTVSGRVVRDINLAEIEDLRIGTHQTDFAWDGTDEYGNLLANGVYVYRVITDDGNGNSLKKKETGIERFFQKELGKVVILR